MNVNFILFNQPFYDLKVEISRDAESRLGVFLLVLSCFISFVSMNNLHQCNLLVFDTVQQNYSSRFSRTQIFERDQTGLIFFDLVRPRFPGFSLGLSAHPRLP